MPIRKLPPDSEVVKLYESGLSYSAIGAMYGTGKQAVALAIERAGRQRPGNESSGYMPPGLKPEHWHAPAAKRLRELARREKAAAGDKRARPLRPSEDVALDNWLAMLAAGDLVVAYSPDLPASSDNPASPSYGGWHYVKRPEGHDGITAYNPSR